MDNSKKDTIPDSKIQKDSEDLEVKAYDQSLAPVQPDDTVWQAYKISDSEREKFLARQKEKTQTTLAENNSKIIEPLAKQPGQEENRKPITELSPSQIIAMEGVQIGQMFAQEESSGTGSKSDTKPDVNRVLKPGEAFAHYRIEQELGRGGMGIVYKALDSKLNRPVALKLISPRGSVDEKEMARFLQEARLTAQLQHPNIVQIFEVGESPQPYFAMEYIEGTSLKALIQEEKITKKNMVPIFLACARAIEVAHEKGIIHRDLKPANIMLAKKMTPKIMDFGLAKQQSKEIDLSNPGGIMGTPAYMPPEQAKGQKVDARSDVYSLGATLYEAMTRRAPYQGENFMNIVAQVIDPNTDPVSPRTLSPDIPLELESICLKCLEREPEKRYATANALAEDLQNFQENRPIQARPITPWTRFHKWVRRNRVLSGAVAAVFLSLLLGTILTTAQWLRAEEETRTARHETGNAYFQKANSYYKDGFSTEAMLCAGRAIGFMGFGGPIAEYPPLLRKDSEEWKEAENFLKFKPLPLRHVWVNFAQYHHEDTITSIAYSPNGKFLASGSEDKTIKIWDVVSGQNVAIYKGHTEGITSIAYNPNGKFLASGSKDKTIKIWDTASDQNIATYRGHAGKVTSIAYSPNGKFLASGSEDKTIKIWDAASGQNVSTCQNDTAVTQIAYSPDGKFIASTDNSIKIWEVYSGKSIAEYKDIFFMNSNLVYNPNGKSIALCNNYFGLFILDATSGKTIFSDNDAKGVAYSPDGKFLVLIKKKSIDILEAGTQKNIASYPSDNDSSIIINTRVMVYSPDGKFLAIIGNGGKNINIWEMLPCKKISLDSSHSDVINSIAYSPDGKFIASGSNDKTIKIWDIASSKNIATYHGHSDPIYSVIYSPDGKFIASGSNDKTIKIWDIASSKNIATYQDHSAQILSIAYSPDGKFLASSSNDKTIKIWDIASGQSIATYQNNSISITFSPDGKFLACSCNDNTIKIWDTTINKLVVTYTGHLGIVVNISYSPDGKFLAASSVDNSVKIWDTATGKNIITYKEDSEYQQDSDSILKIAYSPDGQFLASSLGEKIKIREISSGKTIATYKCSNIIRSLEYSPDGKFLLVGSKNSITIYEIVSLDNVGFHNKISCIASNPDGKTVCSASEDGSIKIWSFPSFVNINTYSGHSDSVMCVAFSPDGKFLASGSKDKTIKIWEIATENNIATYKGHSNSVLSIAYSPDGKFLVSGSEDKTIKIWDIATGKNIATYYTNSQFLDALAYSPDGRFLASKNEYQKEYFTFKEIKIWDIASGKDVYTYRTPGSIYSLRYSPDGKFLAAMSDIDICIYETKSFGEIALYEGHSKELSCIVYSPDSKFLASGSEDKSIKIWETVTGKNIATYYGHDDAVVSLAYSPDGKFLISCSFDGNIKLWDLYSNQYLAQYLAMAKFYKMELLWQKEDNLYKTAHLSFPVSFHFSIGILRSNLSEKEKNFQLANLYRDAKNIKSCMLLLQQLPEDKDTKNVLYSLPKIRKEQVEIQKEKYFVEANYYFNLKDYNQAIEYYDKAIESDPQDFEAYFMRAKTYLNLMEWEKVCKDSDKAIQLNPDFFEAYLSRGLAYFFLREYKKAFEDCDHAIKLNPNSTNAYFIQGEIYEVLKEYKKAIEIYNKLIQITPSLPNAYFIRGNAYFELKEFKKAIDDYNKTIQINSYFPDVYKKRGNAYCALNEFKKAIDDYNEAIKFNPNFSENYWLRGNIYCRLSEFQKAIEDYNRAIQLNPNFVDGYINRGCAYFLLKEYMKAIENFDKAIQIDPKLIVVYRFRGEAYSKIKEYNKSIKDYNKAIHLNSKIPDLYTLRGICYVLKLDHDLAIADFHKSVELLPQNDWAWDWLSGMYIARLDMKKAKECLGKMSDDGRKKSGNLIEYYLLTGKAKQATEVGEAIYLDTEKDSSKRWIILYMPKYKGDQETIKKYLDLSQKEILANLAYRLGCIYAVSVEFAKADEWFNKAVSMDEEKKQTEYLLSYIECIETNLSLSGESKAWLARKKESLK